MSFSNFLEDTLLDHVFGDVPYTPPTNIYVQLHTGDPGEDCTANPAGETTRVEVTFGVPSDGVVVNDAEVLFTEMSTTETITHFSLWDAATLGNPLGAGALNSPVAVAAGEDARFAVAALTVTLD